MRLQLFRKENIEFASKMSGTNSGTQLAVADLSAHGQPQLENLSKETPKCLIAAITFAGAAESFVSGGINVVLPNIAASFGASTDEISWVVILYLAAFTVALPLTAWFSDVLGQKIYLGASMVLFMLASFGCAVSSSLPVFLAMRVLQGIAGAPFMVRMLVTVSTQLKPASMGPALDFFLVAFAFKTASPAMCGYLADQYSWQYLFLIPIPLVGIGALIPLLFSQEVWPRRRHAMPDLPGMILLIVGLGGLYITLYRGQQDAWFDSSMIRNLIMLAALTIPLFVWHQQRQTNHSRLLSWKSLSYPGVVSGLIYGFFMGICVYGGIYLLPRVLRVSGLHDATSVGVLTSIDSLATLCGLAMCSWFMSIVRTRTWLIISGLLFTTSMILFAINQTSATPDEAFYLPLILRGLSIGFLLPPAGMYTFRAVTSANHGHTAEARGLYYTTRQLGGAMGVAVIVALLDIRQMLHSSQLSGHLTAVNPAVNRTLAAMSAGLAHHGLDRAISDQAAYAALQHMVTREAMVLAYQDIFYLLAIVGIAMCLLTFRFKSMRDGTSHRKSGTDESSLARLRATWSGWIASAFSD